MNCLLTQPILKIAAFSPAFSSSNKECEHVQVDIPVLSDKVSLEHPCKSTFEDCDTLLSWYHLHPYEKTTLNKEISSTSSSCQFSHMEIGYISRKSYIAKAITLSKYSAIYPYDINFKNEYVLASNEDGRPMVIEPSDEGSKGETKITASRLENIVDAGSVIVSVGGISYCLGQMFCEGCIRIGPLFGAIGGGFILGEIFLGRAYDKYLRTKNQDY